MLFQVLPILFDQYKQYLFGHDAFMPEYMMLPLVVLLTTLIWITVTYLTPAEKKDVLLNFYKKTSPGGPGWKAVVGDEYSKTEAWSVPSGILALILALIMIYSLLFATGYFIYGNIALAFLFVAFALISAYFLNKIWVKIRAKVL